MQTVAVRIEGISPLLMHRFPVTTEPETKIRNQKKNRDTVEDYLYLDEAGKLVQPSTHLIGAMKRAGSKYQVPGSGKMTFKNIVGSGAVIIDPDMIPHEMQGWQVDVRSCVIQKARIVRSRPA